MIDTRGESATAKIISLCGRTARVVVEPSVVCSRCAAGNGCGAGRFQNTRKRHVIDIEIPAGQSFLIGDDIELLVGSRSLLRAALLAYGLPLMMLLGTLTAYQFFSRTTDDLGGILWATAGLLVGCVLSRRILSGEFLSRQFAPLARRVRGNRCD